MAKPIDLTGQRFGRLVVVERGPNSHNGKIQWYCDCDCGKRRVLVSRHNLRSGDTKSCGCLKLDFLRAKLTTHGHSRRNAKTRTYQCWVNMTTRCQSPQGTHNPKNQNYQTGGIRVCDRWKIFENFLADMGECPPGCSIDRISNELGYFKENCRWATPTQQSRNRRNVIWVDYNGEKMVLAECLKAIDVSSSTYYRRIKKGMTPQQAVDDLAAIARRKRINPK